MEHYGSITTPVSVPRLIVGAMLAAGVAVLIMAFTKYGSVSYTHLTLPTIYSV